MAEADRDQTLRDMAANRGCKLVKSRRRKPGTGDYGRYGLKNAAGSEVFGFGSGGLTATAEEVETFLRQGLAATWKSSLAAAGPAAASRPRRSGPPPAEPDPRSAKPERVARPKPARRPPHPRPEPEPKLRIRDSTPRDAEALAELLRISDQKAFTRRLKALVQAGEPPLVAEKGQVCGLVAWHVIPPLAQPGSIGRITALVVAEDERRSGIGGALLKSAEAKLLKRGCTSIEALAEIDLAGASSFFREVGYVRTGYRFEKASAREQNAGSRG
jgi:N-acetylglutamate synthase-like GNAT family acetyltransferase